MHLYYTSKFIILIICAVFTSNGLGQLYEGDRCTMPSTETNGICKLLSFCPSAIESLKKHGIFPKNCGFKNTEPIVCCGNASATNIVVHTTSTIPPAINQSVILQVGDKSKQKCEQYRVYAIEYETILLPGIDNPVPTLSDCPFLLPGMNDFIGPPAPREFPHMALIGFAGDDNAVHWGCSGSLISKKFVLSAAHCTYHKQYLEPKHILLGELVLDSETDDAMPQKIRIKNIILHPHYQPPSAYNDIALFELEYNAILNGYTRPACLNTNPNLKNRFAVEIGWRSLPSVEYVSKEMRQHVMKIISTSSECNRTYRRSINVTVANGIVEEIQLCAEIDTRSKGHPCLGNSGGPLQIANRDIYCMYDIIGIASFGKFCGKDNNPGVYTKVSAYIEWIEDIVWA